MAVNPSYQAAAEVRILTLVIPFVIIVCHTGPKP